MLQEVWHILLWKAFYSRLSMHQHALVAKTFNYLSPYVASSKAHAAHDAGLPCCYLHNHVNLNYSVGYSHTSLAVYWHSVLAWELIPEHHQTSWEDWFLTNMKDRLCCFIVSSFSLIMPTRTQICTLKIFPGRRWMRKAAAESSTISTEFHVSFVAVPHTHTLLHRGPFQLVFHLLS